MSLISENPLDRVQIGTIIDNEDPTKKGRVRVTIPGLLELAKDVSPWIYPIASTFLGGSGKSLAFSVPELGSVVLVEFPYGDILTGFYSGHWITEKEMMSRFLDDYPNSYGFEDSCGNWFRINKKSKITEVHHNSGTHITILADGTLHIDGMKDWTADIANNIKFTAGGDITFEAAGSINEKAASLIEDISGDIFETAGGSISNTAGGIHSSKGSSISHG